MKGRIKLGLSKEATQHLQEALDAGMAELNVLREKFLSIENKHIVNKSLRGDDKTAIDDLLIKTQTLYLHLLQEQNICENNTTALLSPLRALIVKSFALYVHVWFFHMDCTDKVSDEALQKMKMNILDLMNKMAAWRNPKNLNPFTYTEDKPCQEELYYLYLAAQNVLSMSNAAPMAKFLHANRLLWIFDDCSDPLLKLIILQRLFCEVLFHATNPHNDQFFVAALKKFDDAKQCYHTLAKDHHLDRMDSHLMRAWAHLSAWQYRMNKFAFPLNLMSKPPINPDHMTSQASTENFEAVAISHILLTEAEEREVINFLDNDKEISTYLDLALKEMQQIDIEKFSRDTKQVHQLIAISSNCIFIISKRVTNFTDLLNRKPDYSRRVKDRLTSLCQSSKTSLQEWETMRKQTFLLSEAIMKQEMSTEKGQQGFLHSMVDLKSKVKEIMDPIYTSAEEAITLQLVQLKKYEEELNDNIQDLLKWEASQKIYTAPKQAKKKNKKSPQKTTQKAPSLQEVDEEVDDTEQAPSTLRLADMDTPIERLRLKDMQAFGYSKALMEELLVLNAMMAKRIKARFAYSHGELIIIEAKLNTIRIKRDELLALQKSYIALFEEYSASEEATLITGIQTSLQVLEQRIVKLNKQIALCIATLMEIKERTDEERKEFILKLGKQKIKQTGSADETIDPDLIFQAGLEKLKEIGIEKSKRGIQQPSERTIERLMLQKMLRTLMFQLTTVENAHQDSAALKDTAKVEVPEQIKKAFDSPADFKNDLEHIEQGTLSITGSPAERFTADPTLALTALFKMLQGFTPDSEMQLALYYWKPTRRLNHHHVWAVTAMYLRNLTQDQQLEYVGLLIQYNLLENMFGIDSATTWEEALQALEGIVNVKKESIFATPNPTLHQPKPPTPTNTAIAPAQTLEGKM